MKFTKYFQNMYYVTIAVLLVVAVVENIGRGFPVNLVVAVLTASVLDVVIKRLWLKRKPVMPLSATTLLWGFPKMKITKQTANLGDVYFTAQNRSVKMWSHYRVER